MPRNNNSQNQMVRNANEYSSLRSLRMNSTVTSGTIFNFTHLTGNIVNLVESLQRQDLRPSQQNTSTGILNLVESLQRQDLRPSQQNTSTGIFSWVKSLCCNGSTVNRNSELRL